MNKESLRGIVLKKVGENSYLVKILRENGTCSACGFSKFCSLGGKDKGEDIIEVRGNGLSPGDEVICEEKITGIIFATGLIFLVPIIAFLLGYYVGVCVKFSEPISAIFGFALMGVYFLILRLFDKKLTKSLFKFEVKRKS
ncbi:MAG: SoxR reducing system RseC family protein [bacterium]|nr:SoxR reducing system RseC family protein [bacterium]